MLGPVAGLSFIPAVHRVEQRVFSNQIAASALMASSVFCGPYAAACAAANAAYLSSLHGGGLMDMGKAAAIAYVTAAAFQGVGALSAADGPLAGAGIGSDGLYAANVAGSAMVGCASTAAGGGSCGSGALSAGFGAAAAPAIAGLPKEWRLVSAMIAGGTGSVLGGGKFGNGATTAAFQYLFSQAAGGGRGSSGPGMSGVSASEQLACGPACPAIVVGGEMAMEAIAGTAIGAAAADAIVHGNSADSMRGTEVYYLINNGSGAIDKIGITSNPETRYSDAYLRAENVRYETQAQYTWRYAAMVDENIRLTFYRIENGQLPRLNKVTR
jgi:hypothetical protein